MNQKKDESVVSSDIKSLKNPKITIQVNNAVDIHKPYVDRDVMWTSKTTIGSKEIQISSTKSREGRNFVFLNRKVKNSVTPT